MSGGSPVAGVPVKAIAEAVLERMARLGLTWRLRPARVVSVAGDGTVRVVHDGDTVPIRVVSMVGPVAVNAKVFVLKTPPAGNHIVGWAARPSTAPIWARKTDEPQNNSTAFLADPQLVLPIPAAGTYALSGAVWYRSSAVADFKGRFVFSAGSGGMRWSADGPLLADPTKPSFQLVFDAGTLALGATGTFDRAWVHGTVTANGPGALTLEWGQNTADGAATTFVLRDSWLRLEAIR
ncbi:hypothetical protein GA0070610_1780 [Micromonospora echinofusca]|uniref:Uncharacterized protein n=1 Tax=Micromonospora echinofusca TaxID=47858 RepID=A0A1C5G950_MICEH|nr:hypothetical protein [Micromonospora echinofusca]SCG15546.1 hypothetical protein GA0070610_1780 [Micromonospora echinofusca]